MTRQLNETTNEQEAGRNLRLVMKFGGISVDGASGISRVVSLVKHFRLKGNEVVAVVSAMAGVTDQLIESVNHASKGDLQKSLRILDEIKEKHLEAMEAISKDELKAEAFGFIERSIDGTSNFLRGVAIIGEATPRARDYILSLGEQLSAKLISLKLLDEGLPARYMTGWDAGVITNDKFGDAEVLSEAEDEIRARLEPLLARGEIPVVTGFIGSTRDGRITTLGRGGSDYSAAVIASALRANELWMWKDVGGVMSADPKIVKEAKPIKTISYDEAEELSYFGAKVLHPRTLQPLKRRGIPIRVKNVFDPDSEGTLIASTERVEVSRGKAKAVTMRKNVVMYTVRGMRRKSFRKMLTMVEEMLNGNVILLSQSFPRGSLTIISQEGGFGESIREVARMDTADVIEERDVALIAVVGMGMRGVPGVAAKVFKAVADRGINIRAIMQGPSELSISFVVKMDDAEEAVRAVHEAFGLG